MPDCSPSWFVVLPDCEPARRIVERLSRFATRCVSHASGRPWLLGDWAAEDAVTVAAGDLRVVVLGRSGPDVRTALGRLRRLSDLDGLAGGPTSGCHVLASLDGTVRVQAPVFGARRLFHAVAGEVTVAADRAHTLAWLSGAGLDDGQLAARLAYGGLPHPLAHGSVWREVHGLAGHDALYLCPDGGSRTTRWWRAPAPVLSAAEGAAGLRQALLDAVASRIRPGEAVAADLSGGLDSTSVCFAAAAAGADLRTVTIRWTGEYNEDVRWARLAAEQLSVVAGLVYEPDQLPTYLTGVDRRWQPSDEPTLLPRGEAQRRAVAADLLDVGAQVYLCGHGGDAMVHAPWHHLRDTFRRRPLLALRHAAGYRAMARWSFGDTVRALADSRPYRKWLAGLADDLAGEPTAGGAPRGWGDGLWLPPWSGSGALDAAAAALLSAARTARPLAGTRGQHARIQAMQASGRQARQLEQASSLTGLPILAPFCDDRVAAACLAVRPDETRSPWDYKPLLKAAMRDLVPPRSLSRTTKDHATGEWYRGLRAHRRALIDLADGSLLAERGLVRPDALRAALTSPETLRTPTVALEQTVWLECWLRDLADNPEPAFVRKERRHDPAVTC
jgi:asparagine synthase (glutamine-hydrolysing)